MSDFRVVFDAKGKPIERMLHSAPQYMPELERIAWAIGYNAAVRELLVKPLILGLAGKAA